MKKRLCFCCFLLFALACFALPVSASESETEEQMTLPPELQEPYFEMLDAVPEEIAATLPDGLRSSNGEEIAGAVEEMLTPSYLLHVILETVGLHLSDAMALLSTLCGILILSAVFAAFRKSQKSETFGRTVSLVASCAILSAILGTQFEVLHATETYFSELSDLAAGMIPALGLLYAIGGNLTGAATGSTGMMLFLAVSETVGEKLILPTAGICMALSLVPVFAPGVNLRPITSCIKKTFTFCLGFLMMLLSALLAMKSSLAAKADSVGGRTVKFIASSMIPVVGGSVADSLRTVGASVEYLRTTVGLAGILLIVLLLLPFLINLLMTRLVLILSSSVAEILGCEGEARLLSEFVSVYGYLLAVAVMSAIMFIFALTLLVRTGAAIG